VGDSAAGHLKSAAATNGGTGDGQCSATDFMAWLKAVKSELDNGDVIMITEQQQRLCYIFL